MWDVDEYGWWNWKVRECVCVSDSVTHRDRPAGVLMGT